MDTTNGKTTTSITDTTNTTVSNIDSNNNTNNNGAGEGHAEEGPTVEELDATSFQVNWSCPNCTFSNSPSDFRCNVCNGPRSSSSRRNIISRSAVALAERKEHCVVAGIKKKAKKKTLKAEKKPKIEFGILSKDPLSGALEQNLSNPISTYSGTSATVATHTATATDDELLLSNTFDNYTETIEQVASMSLDEETPNNNNNNKMAKISKSAKKRKLQTNTNVVTESVNAERVENEAKIISQMQKGSKNNTGALLSAGKRRGRPPKESENTKKTKSSSTGVRSATKTKVSPQCSLPLAPLVNRSSEDRRARTNPAYTATFNNLDRSKTVETLVTVNGVSVMITEFTHTLTGPVNPVLVDKSVGENAETQT